LGCGLSICDIDFFNFHDRQVRKFKISKLSEWNKNSAIIFQNHLYWQQKSTKYITNEQKWIKLNDITKKILLVSWNIINFHKLLQTLINSHNLLLNSVKAQNIVKITWKNCSILSNIGWILITFIHAIENGQKLGKLLTLSRNLMKVHSIEQTFSLSKTFSFNKISSHFVSLMTKIFCFTWILQILTVERVRNLFLFAFQTIPLSQAMLSLYGLTRLG
jgi:hypothetical protein